MENQGYILQISSGVTVPVNIRRYLKAFSRHGFGSWIRHWRSIFHMYLHSYNMCRGWNMRLYAWGSPLKLVYIVTTICRFNNALAAAQDSLKSPSFYIGHSEINNCQTIFVLKSHLDLLNASNDFWIKMQTEILKAQTF